ncbi:hypothetical protein [Burkholderia anthina]|uniref:hypothetical protein n=1 Tax=Burkholderia anthina TaxID=179879 RepID=UPI001AA05B06|nr:hypothetical protein J4G50_37160 [Burkholderia anthina]
MQLVVLDIEAEEARRSQKAADRPIASADALRIRAENARPDPVTARTAGLLDAFRDTVDLAIAIIFGGLLECVACLGWMLALAKGQGDALIEAIMTAVPSAESRPSHSILSEYLRISKSLVDPKEDSFCAPRASSMWRLPSSALMLSLRRV